MMLKRKKKAYKTSFLLRYPCDRFYMQGVYAEQKGRYNTGDKGLFGIKILFYPAVVYEPDREYKDQDGV